MDDLNLWTLVRATGHAIASRYRPVMERLIEESGLDGRSLSLLLAVLTIEPDNTTPAHLLVRDPYSSAELYFARLVSTARLGYLGEVSPGEFRLTPDGRNLVDRLLREARSAINEADPLAHQQSGRLAMIFRKLVQNSLEHPPPPNIWSIRLSHKLMPDLEPPLPYIEQCISCLAAYRDDAHLAAWRDTDLSATAMETLTLIWRKQVDTLTEIVEHLSHRGHPPEVYVDAVDELESLGFLQGLDEDLELTDQGQKFRDQIEIETNKYFFAPWADLTEGEREKTNELLAELVNGL